MSDDEGNWVKLSELIIKPRQENYDKLIEILEKYKDDTQNAAPRALVANVHKTVISEFNWYAGTIDLMFRILYWQGKELKATKESVSSTRESILGLLNLIGSGALKEKLEVISERLQKSENEIEKRKPFFESLENQINEKAEELKQEDKSMADYDFIQ